MAEVEEEWADDPKIPVMTRRSLAHQIAEKLAISPDQARQAVDAAFSALAEHLVAGGRAEFRAFGVFEVVRRGARVGRNLKNPGEPVLIPARSIARFTPSVLIRRELAARDARLAVMDVGKENASPRGITRKGKKEE